MLNTIESKESYKATSADVDKKLNDLIASLRKIGSLAVAFSGGVDSTFLLKVANDILKDKVIAVTAKLPIHSQREFSEAVEFIKKEGIKHIVVRSEDINIEGFTSNPENRCYVCKKEVFGKIVQIAKEHNISAVADGSNVDDLKDYRPGMAALKELGIVSPLKEAGLTKADIRNLSKQLELPTWDKPAYACLASRIPYGEEITIEKLSMIEKSEQFIMDLGFKQLRVRHHGDIARIEIASDEYTRFLDIALMNKIHDELKKIGFRYVALDLKGYRMGSLNENLEGVHKRIR